MHVGHLRDAAENFKHESFRTFHSIGDYALLKLSVKEPGYAYISVVQKLKSLTGYTPSNVRMALAKIDESTSGRI